MYVRDNIKSSFLNAYSSPNIQVLIIELYLNASKILLGVVYKPPKFKFCNELDSILSDLSVKYNDVILVGVFNSNFFTPSGETRRFISLVENLSLKFVNTVEPTYFPMLVEILS